MTTILHSFNADETNEEPTENEKRRRSSSNNDEPIFRRTSTRSTSNLVASTININCNIPIINEPGSENGRKLKALRFDMTQYPIDSDEIRENKKKIRDEIRK